MINQARTLLLNIRHNRVGPTDIGYEYIPETYVPVRLPTYLQTFRDVIFGTAPDNYFLHTRARELMGYLHETELVQYVSDLDSRITYWPPATSELFEQTKARVDIVQSAGPPIRLNVGGNFSANPTTGKSTQDYVISLNNLGQAGLELVTDLTTTAQVTETEKTTTTSFATMAAAPTIALAETRLNYSISYAPALSSGTSTAVLLTETQNIIVTEQYDPDSGLPYGLELEPTEYIAAMRARPVAEMRSFDGNRMSLEAVPTGLNACRWVVRAQVNPKPIIGSISRLELLGEPAFLSLFGVAPKEPYETFKNLWFDHPLPVYRMGGLVLALIYRTNEVRNAA